MKIQKHSIYQISVPFETVSVEDKIILDRYIMLNCFAMDGLNYFNLEIEESYEYKQKTDNKQLIRIIDSLIFNENEIKGTLHVILNSLSNNEVSGSTETTFIITLFSEILTQLHNGDSLEVFKVNFPDWNIEAFINEPTIPGKIAKLAKMQEEMVS